MSDTDCERKDCKNWSYTPTIVLDAIELRLCQSCKMEVRTGAAFQALWSDKLRLDYAERRFNALLSRPSVASGDIKAHEEVTEKIIASQVERRAFVLKWLSTPAPTAPATEPKETTP